MKYLFRLIVIGLLMSWGSAASAATFCLAGQGLAPQCIYDDVAVCLKSAEPNMYCTPNPEAVLTYSGTSRYCAVSSFLVAECIFSDRSQCENESSRRGGVCLDRTSMTDKYNPFKYDNRVQN